MEAVVIIAGRNCVEELKSRIPGSFQVSEGGMGSIVIEGAAGRAYLVQDDRIADEMDEDQLGQILAVMEQPFFYILEFSDIQMCRDLLFALVDDPTLIVDNDHGVLLQGPMFVDRLRRNPVWDWRAEG